ncbi:scoloptoxin SSD14-like [Chrysoperla carnea]|uniref:scoloptoxin SSD14-like n=1 Tax=Chrysoperla carnea TaxID=189513 RepID=UPI001D062CE7|nr:scoloptoxin SSD14-like [Chrysoperla carnea]XP_044740554.1 scoloptoxin SSD14-like [Chrysoperla carnea]
MQTTIQRCFAIIILLKLCTAYRSTDNIVVSNNGYCTYIGETLTRQGGNAREVFIGVSLCEGLVHPMDSGLGGGFQGVYYDQGQQATSALFIDAREKSPNNPNFINYPIRNGNSIGIPSVLAGYELLYNIEPHKNRLQWSQIIQPVLNLCKTGFYITWKTKEMFMILLQNYAYRTNLRTNIEFKNNVMRNPQLCETLAQISKDGPSSSMYKPNGILHQGLLNDLRASNSFITSNDIVNYRARAELPATIRFDKYTVFASKVPGSGQAILFALKIMERMRVIIRRQATEAEKIVYLLKILKYAYALQSNLRELPEKTINKIIQSGSSIADGIIKNGIKCRSTIPTKFGNVTLARIEAPRDQGTTNIIIKVGNSAVTGSSSINSLFGSGIHSENLGIFYNNHLRDFSKSTWRRKGKPLQNVIGPNKTPSSSIAPIIMVNSNGEPVFQIGSAGGAKILSAIINTLYNYFVLGKTLQDSIHACRILPKFSYARNNVKFQYECGNEVVANYLRQNGIDYKQNEIAGHSAVTAMSKMGRVPEAVFDYRRGGAYYISPPTYY